MKKKPTAKRKTLRGASAKAETPTPPGGEGVQGSEAPQKGATDSVSQNLLQWVKTYDEAMLAALSLTRPKVIEVYRMKDGKRRPFDAMQKIGFADPKLAEKHLGYIGHVVRSTIGSLLQWGAADGAHVPTVRDEAQRILADATRLLVIYRYVKLKRSLKGGDAFALRWRSICNRGRGTSDFPAVTIFGTELMQHLEEVLKTIVEAYPERLENAPSHINSLITLVHAIARAGDPDVKALPSYYVSSTKAMLLRPELLQTGWKKIFWPLAKDIWPEFARHFEHWKGFNKRGRALSERKRPVDQKTDFSPARFESEIRHSFEESVRFYRAYQGE